MSRRFARTAFSLVVAGALAGGAFAADGTGKSWIGGLLESALSTADRQVSIEGLDDVFSAHPTIAKITVADHEGVWLELDGVEMAWNRGALLNRTIAIDSLKAARVAVLRKPVTSAESNEASGGGSPPPLAVRIKSIALPQVTLAAPIAGAEAEVAATGSAEISADALDAELSAERQDRAGSLSAKLRLEPKANVLAADVKLSEPAGGIIAELLDLRGRPSVDLALSGTGPLDDWHGTLAMQAGGADVASGSMSVARADKAYRVSADLAASLGDVVPEVYAALLAGNSRLAFDLSRADDGAITIRSATLRSAGVDLAASGAFGADLVPQAADLSLKLGQAGRAALPFVPGGVSVASLDATAGLDPGGSGAWRATVAAAGIEGDFGVVGALKVDVAGQARDLARPDARASSFRLDASASGVAPNDPALRSAVGPTVTANGGGSWRAGEPVALDSLDVVLNGATAHFAGTATAGGISGDFAASVVNLGRFSGLAGRTLAGRADVKAKGNITRGGGFDLALDGTTASGLAVGVPALDPLLSAATSLSGSVIRDDKGLRFGKLALSNERMAAALDGIVSDPDLDLGIDASVADLSTVTPRAAGAAKLTARIAGSRDAPKVEAEASGDRIVLMDRPLAGASARFSGVVAGPATSGEAEITGTLGGAPVRGSANLAAGANGVRKLEGLRLAVGESQVAGDLTIGADNLLAGNLSVVSPDLSKVAPLFLIEASGMLRAEIALSAGGGTQSAAFSGTATDIVYADSTVKSVDLKGQADDLFGAPKIAGDFSLNGLTAGGLAIVTARGNATREGESTAFSADAKLSDGSASVAGSLVPQAGGFGIALARFVYQRPGVDLALAAPTTIAVANGAAIFDKAALKSGGGAIVISGRAGSTLDIQAALNGVPAALANAVSPGLGAEGMISGVATAKGSASSPDATFDLTLAGASVAASRNAGLGALGVSARGSLAGKVVNLTSEIFGADGMSLQIVGKIPVAAEAPLSLKVTGGVPLALGNSSLAERGAALEGAVNVDIAVSGTRAKPQFSGRVTGEGGGFVDPETGVVLKNLALAANVSGTRIVVEKLTASSGDGTVSGAGTIGLDANAGFPIDITLQVRKARYVNGTLIAARFDADLKLAGKLSEGPVLTGSVTLDRTEVTVPDRLPRDSVAVDVQHVNPPPPVAETLAALRPRDAGTARPAAPSAGIRLDVAVRAPQRIFIRGRGLDAEFGGDLRVVGPLGGLGASGGFKMVRGRIDILTKRIAFDSGTVTFAGDLDPLLDFSGSTRNGSVTVTVTVTGRASDPQINFSSVPELPQDEILAQLIFGKGIAELSPLQVARLAAAASELSGGQGGILSRLRATTGLDDLDIVTDDQGQTSVAAGRYVSDNVYVGVQQGATAQSSRVTIDLDVTKNVKARAGMSAEGDSSLGLFFEKEY